MKKIMVLGFLILNSVAFAAEWQVLSIKGDVSQNGKKLKLGDKFTEPVDVSVGEKGQVKIYNKADQIVTFLKEGAQLKLIGNQNEKNKVTYIAQLNAGVSRWILKKGANHNLRIKTTNAAMGIRGTDVFYSFNPVLQETEVVGFDGNIDFTNAQQERNKVTVKPGFWGGVGGRFGKTIAPPIEVPKTLLEQFVKQTSIKTDIVGAKKDESMYGEFLP